MLQQIFTVIAPVLLIALLGYVWEHRRLPFDAQMMSLLCSYVGGPCLMLHTLLNSKADLSAAPRIVAAAALMIAIMGVIGWVVVRVMKLPVRVYLPAMMFPNSGNMGLPLCLFAFGESGLALGVTFFATMAGLQFSLGISIASGSVSVRSLVTNPMVVAVALAGALVAADVTPPLWIANVLEVLGNTLIPLMLMSLGASLAKLQVVEFGRSLGFSALRLGGGFVVALGLTQVLGLEGAARGSVIIQSAMPVAVFSYLFALRYDNQPAEVAAMVFLSTVLSFLTLPLLMGFVLNL